MAPRASRVPTAMRGSEPRRHRHGRTSRGCAPGVTAILLTCGDSIHRCASINSHKHPFYQHGAAVQFLARQAGKIVGRISVSDDPRYNAEHNANVGCFGMF